MLDSKRTKGAIKLGVNSAAGTVMTHKQGNTHIKYINKYLISRKKCLSLVLVEQFLQESSYIPPQKSAVAVTDLRCLCTALLEALNDKALALAHQKKANKYIYFSVNFISIYLIK